MRNEANVNPNAVQSPFEILNIPNNITLRDLEVAFRKESLSSHPDQGGDNERYQKIIAARGEIKKILLSRAKLKELMALNMIKKTVIIHIPDLPIPIPSYQDVKLTDEELINLSLKELNDLFIPLATKFNPLMNVPRISTLDETIEYILNTPIHKLKSINNSFHPSAIFYYDNFGNYLPKYLVPAVLGAGIFVSGVMTYQQWGLVYNNLGIVTNCVLGLKLNPYDLGHAAVHMTRASCNTTILCLTGFTLIGFIGLTTDLTKYNINMHYVNKVAQNNVPHASSSASSASSSHAKNVAAQRKSAAAAPNVFDID